MSSALEENIIKKDFPIFLKKINRNRLIYLDNANTTQKPYAVINSIVTFYSFFCSNINRSVYRLGNESEILYENVRGLIRGFINASNNSEILFTPGTTFSLNFIANSFGKLNIVKGDEILISEMEHHANIIPWQLLCSITGAILRIIPINKYGDIDMEKIKKLINCNTKIISIAHVSNVLGVINPVKNIAKMIHSVGGILVVDGAQAINHLFVDVQELDCDFYSFSAHKMYGPMGVGVLYGKLNLLKNMNPFLLGGSMIKQVFIDKSVYGNLPIKFEAGTQNISGVFALGEAVKYIQSIGMHNIISNERRLLQYARKQIKKIPNIKIYGDMVNKVPIISFGIKGIHSHDISSILDKAGIAVRAGHLCAQPLLKKLKIPSLCRVSIGIYNDVSDIDILILTLLKIVEIF